MTLPGLLIIIDVECAPRVICDCLNEGERQRLQAWLEAHPEYEDIVERALELREKAA